MYVQYHFYNYLYQLYIHNTKTINSVSKYNNLMFLLNISYLIDSTPCLQVFSSRRFAIFSDWFKVVHSQIIRLPRCYIVTHYIENNSSNLTLNVIDLSKVGTSFKHRQTIKGSLGYILTHSIQEVIRLYKVYIASLWHKLYR